MTKKELIARQQRMRGGLLLHRSSRSLKICSVHWKVCRMIIQRLAAIRMLLVDPEIMAEQKI